MSTSPHLSLTDWETALTRHFLMATGDETAPVRSFEVSGATLARVASITGASAAETALDDFKGALRADQPKLLAALEQGKYVRSDTNDTLGCFAYLALTILVDSQLEVDAGASEFRAKLAAFIGIRRSFSQLVGVKSMWIGLRDWLADNVDQGRPYRRLILPKDDNWNHIGYSVRLSFPSRRDRTFIGRFLDDNPDIVSDEKVLIARLRNLIAGSKASPGMKLAFDEFYSAYQHGQRALADHRFWRFVQTVAAGLGRPLSNELDLELFFDEDGAKSYMLQQAAGEEDVETYDDLASAAAAVMSRRRSNLTDCIESGYVILRRMGQARWRAASSLADCHGTVLVGLSARLVAGVKAKLGKLEASGEWFLTSVPVLLGRVDEALRKFIKKDDQAAPITNIRFLEGVRTGPNWLGRPSFLPLVSTDVGGLILSRDSGDGGQAPVCEEIDGWFGCYAITTAEPLDGAYTLRPAKADAGIAWSRKMSFAKNALVHGADAGTVAGRPLEEWSDVADLRRSTTTPERVWCAVPQKLNDVMEAIYAGGRRGWSEGNLIQLFQRILPARLSAWDFMRSLQESTLLAPLLRPGFRGRVWRLLKPTLVPLTTPSGEIVVVDGCVGATLVEDFRTAIISLGGAPFRLSGTSEWCPPLLGALNVDVTAAADRLGWEVAPARGPGKKPLALVETRQRHEHYDRASVWSWADGHFLRDGPSSQSPVILARWIHRAGRDHDIYVVSNRGREARFLSRAASIVFAHLAARLPLFRLEASGLLRIAGEGALPADISAWLRYATLANPSALEGGNYRYPIRAENVAKLTSILNGLIDLVSDPVEGTSAIALVRRSGWSDRLVWSNGRLSANRLPYAEGVGA